MDTLPFLACTIGGYLPRSYGTHRLSRPAPVAGTTYTPTYAKSDRTGRLLLCGGLMSSLLNIQGNFPVELPIDSNVLSFIFLYSFRIILTNKTNI